MNLLSDWCIDDNNIVKHAYNTYKIRTCYPNCCWPKCNIDWDFIQINVN